MFEWEVTDEEIGLATEEPSPPRGSRWRGLLPVLFVVALAGFILWWRFHQQQVELRTDFNDVVQSEARLMSFGQQEEAASLRDPEAPAVWTFLYEEQFRWSRTLPALPSVRDVTLEDKETAVVDVAWPLPAANGSESNEVIAQQRYRLVRGRWRRTPSEAEPEGRYTEHFYLYGNPEELDALTDALALDALWEHLDAHWPTTSRHRAPVTIIVEPQIYGRTVLLNDDLFVVNTPRFAPTLAPPEWQRSVSEALPLSDGARYRMNVIEAYLYRSLSSGWARELRGQQLVNFLEFYRQLVQAEARRWALNEEERQVVRDRWREELKEESVSPFDGDLLLPVTKLQELSTAEREQVWAEQRRRRLALALLLEQLVDEEGG
ncbi:MAG: hypothetical protein M3220_17550, partial [Chloroflexota bacterium]|nr:hypothetical protein [Chloroflexota bacterium]